MKKIINFLKLNKGLLGIFVISAIAIILVLVNNYNNNYVGSRTSNFWDSVGTSYIKTNAPSGYGLLINGSNKYINFNSTYGSSGYGIRDNAGVIEAKDSGGAWSSIVSSSGISLDDLSSTATGLTYNNTTGVFSLTSGYNIPKTASTTEWHNKVSSQWTTSGSDIYFNTGKVGIGTTSPVDKLSVTGSTTITGDVYASNINGNEGLLSDPTITDATGVRISVTAVDCLIRDDVTWDGDRKLYKKTITASTSLTVTDNSINYIYAYWNSGNVLYGATTDRNTLNNSNYLPVARVYMDSGDIEHQMTYEYLGRSVAIRNFDRVMRIRGSAGIEKESGMTVSEQATRVIKVSSGYAWFGMSRKSVLAITQNATNSAAWFHSSSNWTEQATSTYNNKYYDNGTNLVELTANRYAVNCVYMNVSNPNVDITFGAGDYTLAQAEASGCQTPPSAIANFYVLVGRIIVQKGASTATAIEQAVTGTSFAYSAAANHNDLLNIQGGTSNEYYHLTSSEHTELNGWLDNAILGSTGDISGLGTATTTNLTVTGNSKLGTVTSGTWNGTKIDVSDYTNLTVTATGLELSSDTIALSSGYFIPQTASNYVTQAYASTTYVNKANASTTLLSVSGVSWFTGLITAVNETLTGLLTTAQATISSILKIPFGADLMTGTQGTIGIDTTSGQFRFNTGSATTSLVGDFDKVLAVASTTIGIDAIPFKTGTSTYNLWNPTRAVTLNSVFCKTDVGTTSLQCWDGTNYTDYVLCERTGKKTTMTTNNTFAALEDFNCKVRGMTGTPNWLKATFNFKYTID